MAEFLGGRPVVVAQSGGGNGKTATGCAAVACLSERQRRRQHDDGASCLRAAGLIVVLAEQNSQADVFAASLRKNFGHGGRTREPGVSDGLRIQRLRACAAAGATASSSSAAPKAADSSATRPGSSNRDQTAQPPQRPGIQVNQTMMKNRDCGTGIIFQDLDSLSLRRDSPRPH